MFQTNNFINLYQKSCESKVLNVHCVLCRPLGLGNLLWAAASQLNSMSWPAAVSVIQPSSGKEKETVRQVSVLGPEKTVKAYQECGSVSNGRRTLLLGHRRSVGQT